MRDILHQLYIIENKSTREIADIYDTSHTRIQKWLRENGISKSKEVWIENSRQKMIGRKATDETKTKMSKSQTGKIRTIEHRLHYRNSKLGKKNPAYRNGLFNRKISQYIRGLKEYNEWRQNIFIRDSFECQDCHCKGYVEAHHKISFIDILQEYGLNENATKEYLIQHAKEYVKLWDTDNGITYCRECHMKHDSYFKNK